MLETQVDDAALVAKVRAGDTDAFDVLARRHHSWLVATCQRHLGGDHHQAEDVAQESLVRLHSAVTRDDRDLRVRPWLSVVARHLCVDHLRRRTPQPVEAVPDTAVEAEDPFDVDPALAEAWSRLAPRHREVLTHRELVGLSYDEVAIAMGTTVPAVETLLFRARASLRKQYKKAGGRLLGCGALLLGLDRLARGPQAQPQAVAHVASCTSCRRALHEFDAVGQVLRGIAPPPAPGRGHAVTNAIARLSEHVTGVLSQAAGFGGQLGTALTAAAVAVSPVIAAPAEAVQSAPGVAHQRAVPSSATSLAPRSVVVPALLPSAAPSPAPGSATPRPWSSPWPQWSPHPTPSWSLPLGEPHPTPSPSRWEPWPEPTQTWPAPWR